MIEKFKEFIEFWNKSSDELQTEAYNEPYKEITNRHFHPELIDWNVQTSMYDMLCSLLIHIDEVHLKTFAQSYEQGWNDCIEVQLRDAMRDVLKHKKLI